MPRSFLYSGKVTISLFSSALAAVRWVGLLAATMVAACSLPFDLARLPGDDAGFRSPPDGRGAGDGANVVLPVPLAFWTFVGTGDPVRIDDRSPRGLGAHLYPVLSSDVGRSTFKNEALESSGGVLRSDPGPGDQVARATIAAGAISVEAWVEFDRTVPTSADLFRATNHLFWLAQGPATANFGVDSTTLDYQTAQSSLGQSGVLRHLVGVFTNATGVLRLYVDGDEAGHRDLHHVNVNLMLRSEGESRLQFGTVEWKGRVYLAAIYDSALAPDAIRSLYRAGQWRAR